MEKQHLILLQHQEQKVNVRIALKLAENVT
jgi:hypothetical protein